MLDRIGVDGYERITDPWTRTDIPGVNEKLAVVTGQDGNASSRTHKDAYLAAKFLDGDLAASRSGPGCLDQTFWSGEQMARGKACNSGGLHRGCERAGPSHGRFWSGKHDDLAEASWLSTVGAENMPHILRIVCG